MAKTSTAALAGSINVAPQRLDTSNRVPSAVPSQAAGYPELRYMGSKKRLLPWIHQVLDTLDFGTALDPFAGTGCVA